MNVHRTPIAVAALALCGALPIVAEAAPTATWIQPLAGATLRGRITGAACAVTATSETRRVSFYAGNWQINNDYSSPFNCDFDTTRLNDGVYNLRARAYNSGGSYRDTSISVTIANNTATNTAPTVSISSPSAGQTVSGTLNYAANATDNAGVSRVSFFLDGSTTALLNDTASPYGGSLNTATLANGTHTLRAVAYDAAGLSTTTQVSFNVQNTTTTTPTTGTNPTIAFTAPAEGGVLTGNVQGPPSCVVEGTNIARVMFYLNGTWTNTDGNLDNGLGCWIDTTRYPNGTYTVRAVAYNSAGATAETSRQIQIQNGTTTTPTNTPPTVSISSPTASQTVSGTISYAASATDNAGVSRVDFFVDGSSTALLSDTAAPYGGSLNTATLANGTHTLRAVAYDAAGLNASTQVSFNVQNTTTGDTSTPTSSLPSTGVRVVPTFESLGVYWTSPGATTAGGCKIQYRKAGDTAFKPGLDLWYDARNNECRGSLVHLQAGSDYEVQLGLPGQSFSRGIVAKTWSEQFPIAQTITLPAGTNSQPLTITQGGTPTGYVLYQAAPGGSTIDVQDAYQYNIRVAAPYVIIRGLTLRGARQDAIDLRPGAHDVVIENNDISGWGRYRTTIGGKGIGMDMDSAVRAHCANNMTMERFILQRNRMHSPRYSANSWDSGHPAGPQGVTLSYCGGNHVIRHNEIAGSSTNYFNDGIGGEDNFTAAGAPNYDSDIYGNIIRNVHDDAIEAEGSNRNVRIWGNYIDQTGIGIATTVTHHGPLYIFRNVVNRQRFLYNVATDSDQRNNLFKAGGDATYGNGRRYVFHNTSLQAQAAGATRPLGAGGGLSGNTNQPLTNTVSRNNILHVWLDNWSSVNQTSTGSNNDVDYDLYNGAINANAGAEANGIRSRPTYRAGHGWSSEAGGLYQLEPGTAGHDRGAVLANFNDGFIGSAPDMGAAESGAPAMAFGVAAAGTGTTDTTTAPAPTNTAPTVSISSPSASQTVAGTISYAANASDNAGVARVVFYLDGSTTALLSDTTSPYGGSLDTTTLANGTHTLRAVAFDAEGFSSSSQVSFNVQNTVTTTPTDSTTTIASADILGQASSEVLFSQQSGYAGQVLGTYPTPPQIPETTGIEGTLLPNGERIRLGKQADPANSARKALVFQLAPTDPITSGNKRAEISFGKNIAYNQVYWVAVRVYVQDWGNLATNDVAIFGTQMHSGDNSRGLSPSFSLVANNGGRSFQVTTVTSTSTAPSQSNSITTRHPSVPIPFGRWADFVFKFRHNVAGNGFLQVWMDGTQILNYTGNLGFNTPGYNDYAKFGYYNWSAGFNTPRKVMLKEPTVVRDPTGSTYTAAALRAHINR